MTSENGNGAASGASHSSTGSRSPRLLLGLDPRPEHLPQVTRRRAEWAREMISQWQMGDAIQLMNELAMRELMQASPDDHAALVKARVKLEVVGEFQETLAQMIDDWEAVEAAREQQEKRYNEHG